MKRWRPFLLPAVLADGIDAYSAKPCTAPKLAHHVVADKILSELISEVLPTIVEREGLPHIAHLICGWGNPKVRDRYLLDHIADFVISLNSNAWIPQSDETGDFHPWQTFAYCAMADRNLLYSNCDKYSLIELALRSTDLNTDDRTDLGHFLYGFSHLPMNKRPRTVVFGGKSRSIVDIVELAIDGHFNGSFEVCRKFHLTEGLCAITTQRQFESKRAVAKLFLDGQLSSLRPLLAIVTILSTNCHRSLDEIKPPEYCLLAKLREILVLGEAIENIYYYAGHLIELAAVALRSGYRIGRTNWQIIPRIIDLLDTLLPEIKDELTFLESFYAFAHYRRGTRMFLAAAGKKRLIWTDESPARTYSMRGAKPHHARTSSGRRPFCYAPPKTMPRPYFQKILNFYNSQCNPSLEARGEFPHFRKILLNFAPLGIHYEFLDCGHAIGLELHCERQEHADHALFGEIAIALKRGGFNAPAFDPDWYAGCGRTLVRYDDKTSPLIVAQHMRRFIAVTLDILHMKYRRKQAS